MSSGDVNGCVCAIARRVAEASDIASNGLLPETRSAGEGSRRAYSDCLVRLVELFDLAQGGDPINYAALLVSKAKRGEL